MSQIAQLKGTIVLLLGLILTIAGCSDGNSKNFVDPDTGKHIAADWSSADSHGAAAKQSSSDGGFASCQECHGTDFSGGISKTACSSCHGINAPHPQNWASGTRTHTTTDESNAAVCALCHTNGANSSLQPTTPASPGTSPGCFNNTLCHDQNPGHAAGWSSPDQHGAAAKKAPGTSSMESFSGCQTCHGVDFVGSGSAVTCLSATSCHNTGSPHAFPWTSTSTYKHSATDEGNASVCALCHLDELDIINSGGTPTRAYQPLNGRTISGCDDGQMCHAVGSMGCTSCHSSTQNGRDAVVGEFNLEWGHRNSARTSADGGVTDGDCIVCHLEGMYTGSVVGAAIVTTGYHKDGNIDLRDPDGLDETPIKNISGGAFTFTKFSMDFAAGSRTAALSDASIADVISQKFCLACHDNDGAQNKTARSNNGGTGTPEMPFGGIPLGANYTAANGAIGTEGLVDVKSQFATTNSSYHPVRGPLNRDFPAQSRLQAPYNNNGNRTGTSGTKTLSVVMNCFDCHNTPTPLTTRTVAAHGSIKENYLRGSIYSTTAPVLCTVCHTADYATNNGTTAHGSGSAFASVSRAHDATIFAKCYNCHLSTRTPTPARPRPGEDYHGFNKLAGAGTDALWPVGSTESWRPYGFIRNTTQFTSTTAGPRPFRGTENDLQSGTATCGTVRAACDTGETMGTYSPGGSY